MSRGGFFAFWRVPLKWSATGPENRGDERSLGVRTLHPPPCSFYCPSSPIWQRHQVESLEVAGSNPSVGTIGSVAQLAEATDSKTVLCGFDSHRSHHGEVTEPGKVPGCYPEASRFYAAAWVRIPPSPPFCPPAGPFSGASGTGRGPYGGTETSSIS
jgi:hypothetical protein